MSLNFDYTMVTPKYDWVHERLTLVTFHLKQTSNWFFVSYEIFPSFKLGTYIGEIIEEKVVLSV